jgi:hypothetical protein
MVRTSGKMQIVNVFILHMFGSLKNTTQTLSQRNAHNRRLCFLSQKGHGLTLIDIRNGLGCDTLLVSIIAEPFKSEDSKVEIFYMFK